MTRQYTEHAVAGPVTEKTILHKQQAEQAALKDNSRLKDQFTEQAGTETQQTDNRPAGANS